MLLGGWEREEKGFSLGERVKANSWQFSEQLIVGVSSYFMRTGPELFFATKHYARDSSAKSWWYILSTTILLAAALTGTLWNFHVLAKIACSILAGLLILRLFVIYHDQQHHAILPRSRLAEILMR